MATKGVELASAYISLSVNTSGVPDQIKRALGQGGAGARSVGNKTGSDFVAGFGRTVESGMKKAMMVGVTAAAGVATAAVGGLSYTLFKGFDRYKSLDATNKRLRAMGKSGEQVQGIMADINSVVEGTPIALDAAAASATQFLSGGIKEGAELRKVMTSIADAAGFSGSSYEELALIFGQVMNKGKFQAEEMMQLNERNIPIQQWLQKELGVTGEALTKMSKDGEISFQNLVDAVQNGAGGMAKSMGDTIDGAISNMQAAVGRVGANFIAAIFGDPLSTNDGPGAMAESINKVTDKIKELDGWVQANQGEIKQFFEDAVGVVKELASGVQSVGGFLIENKELVYGVATAFGTWKAIQGVAALSAALTSINTMLGTTLPASTEKGAGRMLSALGPVAALVAAIAAVDPTENLPGGDRSISDNAKEGNWGEVLLGDAWPWIQDRLGIGADSGGGSGAQAPRGQDALGTGFFTGSSNPSNANTGGALTPENAAVQDYLRTGLGFQGEIGGWREPDGYNEHSSGKASDVMVDSAAQGNALLPNLLRRPGVEYIIWQNKLYYPDGRVVPDSTPSDDPTQGHFDHLHVKTYDQGGVWPSGTLGVNMTGKDEFVLTPEQLEEMKRQGIDPNTVQHGQAQGAAPGPAMGRQGGYIPAAAGNTEPVGQGGLSSIFDLGESAIHGVIDQAASAASMAANGAIAAGSFGAGAAAGPAVSQGISMLASAAKRGVSYGYDLLGIWGEALVEQAMPFGAPRWLGSASPSAFMPQIPGQAEPSAAEPQGEAAKLLSEWAQPGTGQPNSGLPADQIARSAAQGVKLANRPDTAFNAQQARNTSHLVDGWQQARPDKQPLIGTAVVGDYEELARTAAKASRLDAMQHSRAQ